jgi:uncharacterized membrane protein
MNREDQKRRLTISGILLGLGLGGFFDGIVLHQILQWHHMLSHTSEYPTNTIAGLEMNVLADGLFHAATYVFTIAGLVVLWPVLDQPERVWSRRGFVALLILGWGIFNVVEGIINHQVLQIHNVREDVGNKLAWNVGFLVVGTLMVLIGWGIYRRSRWIRPRADSLGTPYHEA